MSTDDAAASFPRPLPPTLASFERQVLSALNQVLTNQGKIMASIADFKATILAKITELQAASADEHTQVLAAIDALKNQVLNVVSDADVAEVTAAFDAAKQGVADIFTPDVAAAASARRKS